MFQVFFLLQLFFFLAQKVGAGAQKSGKAAALPVPPPPRTLNDDIKGWKMTSKDTKGLVRTEKKGLGRTEKD